MVSVHCSENRERREEGRTKGDLRKQSASMHKDIARMQDD